MSLEINQVDKLIVVLIGTDNICLKCSIHDINTILATTKKTSSTDERNQKMHPCHGCRTDFSMAVIKHHYQGNLLKECV